MADTRQVKFSATVQLKKNTNEIVYTQRYQPDDEEYTERAAQVLTVSANSSETLSLGTITTARIIMLQGSQALNYKFNGQTTALPMTAAHAIALSGASVTSIHVVNPSATNACTVTYDLTD